MQNGNHANSDAFPFKVIYNKKLQTLFCKMKCKFQETKYPSIPYCKIKYSVHVSISSYNQTVVTRLFLKWNWSECKQI